MANDEIKHRIMNVYTKFVSDVEPDRLSDWLMQGGVISMEQLQRMSCENHTTSDRCRALLDYLLSTKHPEAFIIVREALRNRNHYLLKYIDNQESGSKFSVQPDTETTSKEKVPRNRTATYHPRDQDSQPGDELESTKEEKVSRNRTATYHPRDQDSQPGDELESTKEGLIATIRIKAAKEGNKSILGLTILDKELFVVSKESSEVEVYDSMNFGFSRRWNLKELIDPFDIVFCDRNKCLYIFDDKDGHRHEILRVNPNGKLIKKWSTKDDGGLLSVTYESNVILTAQHQNKLNEYSPGGLLIREINLSSKEGLRHPWHAIKLTNGNFVVTHGFDDDDDHLHRVCVVDADGRLLKSFGGERGSTIGQTNSPTYLSVDGNGFVLVADFHNHRVLQLDSDLKFKREILSEEHELRYPERIHLDESSGRLFVADNELNNKRILIFTL